LEINKIMGWGTRYSNVIETKERGTKIWVSLMGISMMGIELSHNKKLVNGQAISPPTCDFWNITFCDIEYICHINL
jgi:hypothetical protein